MTDEIYKGHYGWVLTPDAETVKKVLSTAQSFQGKAIAITTRPAIVIAAGHMEISKKEVVEFRSRLLAIKDAHIHINFDAQKMKSSYLIWSSSNLPEIIGKLISGCSLHLAPYLREGHADPLNGTMPVALLKNDVTESEINVSCDIEYLQFAQLDQNFFMVKPLIRVI